MRVLHIARCELTEVNGIQAFEQLEELYASFNQIGDLFDISFLEHLLVLDLEGNNVKDPEQLHYLRRLQKLEELNLMHNPVAKQDAECSGNGTYYRMIQDCCECL